MTTGPGTWRPIRPPVRAALDVGRARFPQHGIATELIAHVLDDVRGSGRTVTVVCPAVREFMDHYPQYEDRLDKNRPGVRSRADAA
jgi:hypothetical protein